MNLPLTQHELDEHHCARPGCRHDDGCGLTLHATCHPAAATWATYDRRRGVLWFTCAACDRFIAEVAVAP